MREKNHNRGVVLIMSVFVVALLAAIVMGMLQIDTEEIQIMRNHMHGAEALAVAEAGLNHALAEIRADAWWRAGFRDKSFAGGAYTVTRHGSQITSVGVSARGFSARLQAKVSVAGEGPPHEVVIDRIRVNE